MLEHGVRGPVAGDRRVWLGVTIAALPCLVWGAISVSKGRDYFTGTNSVIPAATVASLAPGHRACLPHVRFPAGTGRLELAVSTAGGPPTTLRADLVLGPGRYASYARRTLPAQRVDFPLPRVDTRAPSLPGSVCLTNVSGPPTLIGGYPGHYPGDPLPTLDGRALDARVAEWFRPPAGQRRSLVSQASDIFARASLYRPGFVGSWTYWLLILVGPSVAVASLLLLARAGAGVTPRRLGVGGAIAVIAIVNAAAWSLITPPWDAPDEQSHYGYSQYLGETGKVPRFELVRQRYSSLEAAALDAARFDTYHISPDGKPPWLPGQARMAETRLRALQRTLPRDNGGVVESGFYKPAYYALTLPGYYATRDSSVFAALWVMRLVSVLLAGIAAACAYAAVRELLPGHLAPAAGAGLLVAVQPMYGFISGTVNNDAGIAAGAAVLLYLLVRGLRRGLSARLGVAIGLMLALVALLKSIGYALYLPAALAIAVMVARAPGRRARAARGGAVVGAFVAGELIWAAVAAVMGTSFFATPDNRAPGAGGFAGMSPLSRPVSFLSYVWQIFLPRLPGMSSHAEPGGWSAYEIYVKRGWADFGWLTTAFPGPVYVVIATVMFGVAGLAVAAMWRYRDAVRARRVELVVLLLAVIAVVFAIHAAFYRLHPTDVAESGREMFAAFVPLAVVVAGACLAFGRRYASALMAALVTATLALSYASQLLVLSANYS